MKTETLAILSFMVALPSYGFLGFLWLLYDSAYVSAVSATSTSSLTLQSNDLVLAAKIQTLAFLAIFAALATALAIYFIERRQTTQRTTLGMP